MGFYGVLDAILIFIVPIVLGYTWFLIAQCSKLDFAEYNAAGDPVAEAIQKELEERVFSRYQSLDPGPLHTSTIDDHDIFAVWTQVPSGGAEKKPARRPKWFGNCPCCGAPLPGTDHCDYCGSYFEWK